jgi:hypothetical protein
MLLVVLGLAGGSLEADARLSAELPEIVDVVAPARLPVGVQGEIRLTYRARKANIVAVVRAIEDLGGPVGTRATSEREFGVVARAFGYEAGELTIPLSFATPGWKRVTLTLVTDGRELSEAAVVEVEAIP